MNDPEVRKLGNKKVLSHSLPFALSERPASDDPQRNHENFSRKQFQLQNPINKLVRFSVLSLDIISGRSH